MNELIGEWNAAYGNRCLGYVLFTSGDPSYTGWWPFQIQETEMRAIVEAVSGQGIGRRRTQP
jgi:hypothetical protein